MSSPGYHPLESADHPKEHHSHKTGSHTEPQTSFFYPLATISVFVTAVVISFVYRQQDQGSYPVRATPPPYFFSIWGVIYALTGLLLLYILFSRHWTDRTHTWMMLTSMFSILWVVLGFLGPIKAKPVLRWLALIMIVFSLLQVWRTILPEYYSTRGPYLFARNIIAFYLGWATCASCIGLSIVSVYTIDCTQTAGVYVFWIAVATLILFMVAQAMQLKALDGFVGFFLSALWAIVGVIISLNN